jgi:hypothetical protein
MHHLQNEGPGTVEAPGPKGYGTDTPSTDRYVGLSCPHQPHMGGFGCEDRISVTGDHLSFDGYSGVRA